MKHQIKGICANDIHQNWIGEGDYVAQFLSGLSSVDETTISFYKGDDINKLAEIKCGILIVRQELKEKINSFNSKCIIFTETPMGLFADIVNNNFTDIFSDKQINTENCKNISKNVYIESGVVFHETSVVFPNASIFNGTSIGENCIIQAGAVLGGNGMTYLEMPDKTYQRMAQIGRIIIEDNVVIGCNVVVLRGILEATIIGRGTKIGNLVNVGHNTVIGENCYISSSVIIGGATTVGDNCWIAPGVSIRDNVKIGANCTIGVGSVVVKDTEPDSIYYGNPAKLIKLKK